MTALTKLLIATLASVFGTLTGSDFMPEIPDAQGSFSYQEHPCAKAVDPDNCISFNEKTCMMLKL